MALFAAVLLARGRWVAFLNYHRSWKEKPEREYRAIRILRRRSGNWVNTRERRRWRRRRSSTACRVRKWPRGNCQDVRSWPTDGERGSLNAGNNTVRLALGEVDRQDRDVPKADGAERKRRWSKRCRYLNGNAA